MDYALLATPANGVVVQWRTAQAGTTGQVKIAGTVPLYLRIVRSANTFTAYTSPDNVTWTAVAGSSQTISMPSSILAGMAVTSHNATALGTATFDSVALSTATPNDFSIAASPASLSIAQGASGGTSITTALISGSAETVALAVSGLPSGRDRHPHPDERDRRRQLDARPGRRLERPDRDLPAHGHRDRALGDPHHGSA